MNLSLEPVQWLPDGSPSSARFGDTYRSRSGGVAQARTVFLGGCGLPGRWLGQQTFAVLETGLGLGLNFLVTWAAWLDAQCAAPAGARGALDYVAVEAFPVAGVDLVRAAEQAVAGLAPECHRLVDLAQELAAVWPGAHAGWHLLQPAPGGVRLHLGIGLAHTLLAQWRRPVDAVYLDGFAPACNPGMWSPEVLAEVARCCRPGARLASYTVAASVRHGLQQLGFAVSRQAGLPPKRHRLEAVWPGAR